MIVFTGQVLGHHHHHHGKIHSGEHRTSSEVNDDLAAGSFFSLFTYGLVNGNEMC